GGVGAPLWNFFSRFCCVLFTGFVGGIFSLFFLPFFQSFYVVFHGAFSHGLTHFSWFIFIGPHNRRSTRSGYCTCVRDREAVAIRWPHLDTRHAITDKCIVIY